jgi:hypothetical protein
MAAVAVQMLSVEERTLSRMIREVQQMIFEAECWVCRD